LNLKLRSVAKSLSPRNPIRRIAARAWDLFLRKTGSYLDLTLQGGTIRLANEFRSLSLDYEAEALGSFLRALHLGDVVWDVGANIGLYTILAGKKVGSRGQVIAWEPNPATFQLLEKHVRANGLQARSRAIQGAINDGATPEVLFRLDAEAPSSQITMNAQTPAEEVIVVPARSLDAWCEELAQKPRVLKIDVEGAEVLVLRGARRLLSGELGPRPNMLVAVHPQFCGDFGYSAGEVEQVAQQFDYLPFDLQGQSTRPIDYAEYWLVPRESREQFLEAVFPTLTPAKFPAGQIASFPRTRT
jgi:FkbM family methyltransferase